MTFPSPSRSASRIISSISSPVRSCRINVSATILLFLLLFLSTLMKFCSKLQVLPEFNLVSWYIFHVNAQCDAFLLYIGFHPSLLPPPCRSYGKGCHKINRCKTILVNSRFQKRPFIFSFWTNFAFADFVWSELLNCHLQMKHRRTCDLQPKYFHRHRY